MNASQRASCSSVTHSFGWCACAMWPGPQMIVGIAAPWNSDASVPNDTLPWSLRAVAGLAERGDVRFAVRVEAGHRRQRVELDVGVRGDLAHLRQEALRVGLHLGEERVRIVERQVADLEVELAVARHDVERGAAADDAGVHGRVRDVVGVVERRRGRGTRAPCW